MSTKLSVPVSARQEMEDFLDEEGFIQVDEILRLNLENEFFPGLLPSRFREMEFPQWCADAPERHYMDGTATCPPLRTALDKGAKYMRGDPFDATGGVYRTASDHSENYDEARTAELHKQRAKEVIRRFYGASQFELAIAFNTSYASNLVGAGFDYRPDDVLILQQDNHNSQIITPRRFARRAGARVVIIPISAPEGRLDLEALREVAVSMRHSKGRAIMFATHASNVTGVLHPVDKIIDILRSNLGDRAFIYLDIAQSSGHVSISLDSMRGVDAAGTSAHKAYGMKGVGALFVRKGREDLISHGLLGGGTVLTVDESGEILAPSPQRFEIGTQNLEGFVEWSFVIERLEQIGMSRIERHNEVLGKYLLGEMTKLVERGLIELYGPRTYDSRIPIFTFNIGSWRATNHEVVTQQLNDLYGVANRNGCFCAPMAVAQLMGMSREDADASVHRGVAGEHGKMAGAVRCSAGIHTGLMDTYAQIRGIREIARSLLGR